LIWYGVTVCAQDVVASKDNLVAKKFMVTLRQLFPLAGSVRFGADDPNRVYLLKAFRGKSVIQAFHETL